MSRPPGPRPHSIYALLDPRDTPPTVRYIGCTNSAIDTRFSLHLSEAINGVSDRPKDEWIREVLWDEQEPTFQLLERVPNGASWEERERYWISVYAPTGLLTNVATGGAGSPGAARTEQTKKKIGDAFRGRTLTEEHKAKLSQAKLGHSVSQETRERISEKLTGRVQSAETVAKRRAAQHGFRHSDASKQQISATRKRLIAEGVLTMPYQQGSNAAKARVTGSFWINDGAQNRRLPAGEPIPQGWQLGRALSPAQQAMYQNRRKAQPTD